MAGQTVDLPVVLAVLFYSPSCGHCHLVINDSLIPLLEQYGDQLQILGVDVSQPSGQVLYQASSEYYQVPQERMGVPRLIVDDRVMVGSLEIPAEFPGIVEEGLAQSGIDWPSFPGMAEIVANMEAQAQEEATQTAESTNSEEPTSVPTEEPVATEVSTPTSTPEALALNPTNLPPQDPSVATAFPEGGALAAAVLGGMVLALGFALLRVVAARESLFSLARPLPARARSWAVPILAVVGLGVSLYLAYVEIGHVEAVCGPVGECNIVQTSQYASILGIPVAVLGVLNYVAILALWAVQSLSTGRWADLAGRALIVLTIIGVLFSVYLTLLELFVIRAVCAWCLSSAVITTLIMLLVLLPVTQTSTSGRQPKRSLVRQP
jgi:uncharacterized membrane protein/thiol-disulfide isomerase/thioredoxin